MIRNRGYIYFMLVFAVLLSGCKQSVSTVGTIEIDADKPVLHEGKLPVGITLGGLSKSGKDLLSPNILINSGFELAPRLENCRYDFSRQLLTTPNGYTTFYPVPELLFGWKSRGGFVSLQKSGEQSSANQYHLSLQPARDSLQRVEVINTAAFSLSRDSQYTFRARLKSSSDSLSISVCLADTAWMPVSTPQRINAGQVWTPVSVTLTSEKDVSQAHLMIKVEGRGTSFIDDIRLVPQGTEESHGLSGELLRLIREFDPGFMRFPDGRTANGFFVDTYPEWTRWMETESRRPIWTLNQQEYTGEFGLKDFLSLSKELRKPPILISNIGITDRGASPRAENIKLLDERVASHIALAQYLLNIYDISKDSVHLSPAIQPGYDMTSYDYFRRFKVMSEKFRDNEIAIDLISSGDITSFQKFSNYIFDVPCTPISSPELSAIVPDIHDDEAMLRQPIMLGECHFSESDSSLFVPKLILRAAFLINAENQVSHLRGLTVTPFLAEVNDGAKYPLIHVDGGRYTPTALYHLMKAFIAMRGTTLRSLNEHTPKDQSPWSPLYASLTSSADNKVFYLKAVNTTRHPLPYKVLFKGKDFSPNKVRSLHFIPKGKTTTTELKDFDHYSTVSDERKLDTSDKEWQYTFKPYEIVFFEFTSR